MFIALFALFFGLGYAAIHAAFPVTKLPKLGILDPLMGLLLGIIVAAVMVALFQSAIGLMVSERWTNPRTWITWRNNYLASPLRPFSIKLLSLYRWLFAPFFRIPPPILTPQ